MYNNNKEHTWKINYGIEYSFYNIEFILKWENNDQFTNTKIFKLIYVELFLSLNFINIFSEFDLNCSVLR